MAKNKTQATEASVASYLAAIEPDSRREDCQELSALMTNATKEKPKMWGPSIVGFGSRHYKYESGREGDTCVVGFASRKNDIVIYGLGAVATQQPEMMAKLGKHKAGKGCLYLSRLSDIDRKVLEQLIARGFSHGQMEE